jgi:DNA topoisomerase-2
MFSVMPSCGLLLIIVQMAIWSLTQERVEKILRQIGDKEMEIDTLLKLSSKDLWTRDLDAFLEEWHLQLEDEKTRKKKIAGISRRASAKLGINVKGGRKKKRAGSDDESSDDDFVVSSKKRPKSVMDRVKPKAPSTLMSFFNQPAVVPQKQPTEKKAPSAKLAALVNKPKSTSPADHEDDFMDIDAPEVQPEVVAVKKAAAAAKAKPAPAKLTSKPKKIVDLSDDEDDVFAAVAEEAKTKRGAELAPSRAARAKKPTKYVIDDDSDSESNDDDMLGDVSMMVKGIGGTNGEASSRPLFTATARPGSSHGLPKPKPKSRSRSISDEDGVDNTDYTKLIPQDSPRRPAARSANETMFLDDDDDEDIFDLPPPKAASKAKPAPKAAAKPVAKKAAAPKTKPATTVAAAQRKVMPLSPAAKAYARKLANGTTQAKDAPSPKKKAYESDSEEEQQDEEVNKLADQLLSDEDEDMDEENVAPVARPARRAAVAAVTKTKKYVVSDEEESEEEGEETDMTGFDDDESD